MDDIIEITGEQFRIEMGLVGENEKMIRNESDEEQENEDGEIAEEGEIVDESSETSIYPKKVNRRQMKDERKEESDNEDEANTMTDQETRKRRKIEEKNEERETAEKEKLQKKEKSQKKEKPYPNFPSRSVILHRPTASHQHKTKDVPIPADDKSGDIVEESHDALIPEPKWFKVTPPLEKQTVFHPKVQSKHFAKLPVNRMKYGERRTSGGKTIARDDDYDDQQDET